MSKRGVLKSRAREIVIHADKYFQKEREDSKVLLKQLSQLLNKVGNSSHVLLSKELLAKLVDYLKNTTKVTERVVAATGICKNTVAKIRSENKTSMANCSKIQTPTKKKRGKKQFLDSFGIAALRNIINSIYTVRKEVPTMRKIMATAKSELNYQGCETTLRQIMKKSLGYRFRKCRQNRIVLIERPQVQAWRARYLRRLKENDALGTNKKSVIYIDETWIHAHYTVSKCWQSHSDPGVRKNDSPGRRWILVHAGSEKGFVDGAQLLFKANTKTGDYHDQMNSENFTKWLKEKLFPNIPPNSIIVMDNAPYHSQEENKVPNMKNKKEEMIDWLTSKNIKYPEKLTKPELYLIIKKNKPPKEYIVDKLIANHGHEVLRLPPYNCDLNPIEYIWNLVKQRVAYKNVEQLESKIEPLLLESLQSITATDWVKEINHVQRLREQYWTKDRLMDDLFIINTGDGSDAESSECISDSEDTSEEEEEYMSGVE